jgi:hypothetical protein
MQRLQAVLLVSVPLLAQAFMPSMPLTPMGRAGASKSKCRGSVVYTLLLSSLSLQILSPHLHVLTDDTNTT